MGTVIFSNDDTRLIVFEADGNRRADREYFVAAAYWTDETGRRHRGGFPSCLTSPAQDPVRTDHRRVAIDAFLVTDSEADRPQIAVGVHCFS
ncbi:hypothetical protein ACFQX7_30570 [Luedemannella flava]